MSHDISFQVQIDTAGGEGDCVAYVKVGSGPTMTLDAKHGWILAESCDGTAVMMSYKEACKKAAAYIRKVLNEDEAQGGEPVYISATGDCVCCVCARKYFNHKMAKEYVGWQGRPWLYRLCDGSLVKL